MKADQSSIKMCQIFCATTPWNMLCETVLLSAPASDTVREEQKNSYVRNGGQLCRRSLMVS